MNLSIEREAIFPRIDGIRHNLKRLGELALLPLTAFSTGDSYDLAQHHLRLALEGVFHISSHILSRLPGGRAAEYKSIALKMGELGIVPREFAERALVPMAGMRNILVHAYSDIDSTKLYEIIRKHRQDIESFLSHIKVFLDQLDRYGLTLS